MSLLVLRHATDEGLGLFLAPLLERGLPWTYSEYGADLEPSRILPAIKGLVVLGGTMSATGASPEILSELYLIERALQRELPILGVCLGAQLTAKALGSRVGPSPRPELGWGSVSFKEQARTDRLFRHFPALETVFQWHYESFDIPAGAVALASSPDCPNQAYRHGDSVWGMQFHLEVSPDQIASWLAADALLGEAREIRHEVDPCVNATRLRPLAHQVFSSFLDAVEERQVE